MKTVLSIVFFVLTISVFPQTKTAQLSKPLSEGSAKNEGMSEARLARIDSMLNQSISQKEVPGAVALVARNGKVVYYKAFGKADIELNRDLKRDDIFRIASQTKAITATAVMMLWEEGKFQLDDSISKFIRGFENVMILDSLIESDSSFVAKPATNPITIRDLLTHTSGLGYGFIDADVRFRKIYQKTGIIDAFTTQDISLEKNINRLAKLPLHHEPGEKFTYSEGLDVLGYLVELLSGMPLDEFFRKRIFLPLEMYDTYFYLPDSKSKKLVPIQTKVNGEWVRFRDTTYYDPDYPVKGAKAYFSGGAGLSSTAKDYANFLQMYLNNGEYNGKRLLSRTTVQAIIANQTGNLFWDEGEYYGLAFAVINKKGQNMGGRGSAGTFEWGGYFDTQYFADPKERIIGILFKQVTGIPSDDTGWKFKLLVEQAVDD